MSPIILDGYSFKWPVYPDDFRPQPVIKSKVNVRNVASISDLKNSIETEISELPQEYFCDCIMAVPERCRSCSKSNGNGLSEP